MASTYENNLRLNEMGTGDQSGTWGTVTNTNLELIAEAFSYQTEATFNSDGDKTATIGDGVTDKYRAMYIKVTSTTSLSATRTLNIAPNTLSKMFIIENATTGGQSIAVSQGSGADVTIANGTSKIVFTDGLGSGAAVYDGLDKIALSANTTIGGSTLASQIANFITASSTTTLTNKTFDANGTGNSISNIENADISASAAIDFSKMANLTVNRALISDSNGDVVVSNVLADEINHLDGATSNIQQQLNNKVTPSSSATFTNKGGNISQWTNNSGYITSYTTSYSQGSTSGYIKFTNGMQMCWAKVYHSYYGTTWTYPLSFSNAVVSASKHDIRSNSSGDGSNYVYNITTSSLAYTGSVYAGHALLMAIGY